MLDRGYSAEDLRYFYMQAHYRSFQDFTWEGLGAMRKARKKLKQKLMQKNDKEIASFLAMTKAP